MRRKNLRSAASQTAIDADLSTVADNFWGIDLNRNSAEGFAQNQGSSGSVTSLIYRGPAPASEPEITALQAAAALGPVARLRLFGDLHSFSQVFFTPQTGNARRDAVTRELVNRLRGVTDFQYRAGFEPAGIGGIGTTADYFAYSAGIPAWTHELEPLDSGAEYGGTGVSHSGFILPDSEVARMRDEIAQTYVLGFYTQAGPPRVAAVDIRDAETDAVAYRADWVPAAGGARMLAVSTNEALLPGRRYRLWLAFDKPMRFRDANGVVVAYAGQSTTPATGTAVLEIGDAAESTVAIPVGNAQAWLNAPGGAPAGYQRYADDALLAEFTVPADLDLDAAVPAVLAVDNRDLSGLALDGDPATAADFTAGFWNGYEDARGTEGDSGGVDCSAHPFVAPAAGAASPAGAATCMAAQAPPPPPPPAPPPGGGGGGAAGWWLLALCLLAALRDGMLLRRA